MAFEIEWTDEAINSYSEILEYLNARWPLTVTTNFIFKTENVLKRIAENPKRFRKSELKQFHEVLITKHNLVIFLVDDSSVKLITFFDTRQNPKKKKRIVKAV